MSNYNVINRHFDTLRKRLIENDRDKLFNVDESGISMDFRLGKVAVTRGAMHAHSLSKGARNHITVNCCVAAAGQVLLPMIIFEKAFPLSPYFCEGPTNALYAKSPIGDMDLLPFLEWFQEIFIVHTSHLGKILLFINGHCSHITVDLINAPIHNNIILYCLLPHATHILQPLDVAVYRPLKMHFSRITDFITIATLNQPKKSLYIK